MRPWAAFPAAIQASAGALWRRQIGVPGRNRLRNSGCMVNQRSPGAAHTSTSPFPNTAKAPILDFWLLQSDGDDRADVSQDFVVNPTGGKASIKFEVETVSSPSEKMGLVQVIESHDCHDLRSGKVSLQFKARTSAGTVQNLRCGILEWAGTVDAPTLPVAAAAAWGAAGTNPTLAANLTYVNTPANLALTNSFQTFKIEGVSLGATFENLLVFIWTNDTDLAANDLFWLADLKLEEGPYSTRFVQPDFTEELLAAGRRFRKTFPYLTAPAQNAGVTGALRTRASNNPGGAWFWDYGHPPMRRVPTLVSYNPSAANALGRDITGGADIALGTTTVSERDVSIDCTDALFNTTTLDFGLVHLTLEGEFQ